MQRLSHRFGAAIAALAGFAGLASAQNIVSGSLPNIPLAPMQSPAVPAALPSSVVQAQATLVPQGQAPQQGVIPKAALPQAAPGAAPAPGAVVNPGPGPAVMPAYLGSYNSAPNAIANQPWTQQKQNVAFGVGLAPVPYNEYCTSCANGCGSIKSDIGFIFGSCKNFFNPCGPKPCGSWAGGCGAGGCGAGGCGHGHGHCPTFPYGTPYGKPYCSCIYDSYLNH